ncbi:hypothetical protein [Niabella hibiscisoli]|uniref:hypothetical protein n=1 Tax=Niabella hibiscisoli TaxID=1825928 RepID=UPI001F0E9470|nr:hypothetical protein [Niabella hibiscisoli]MCH5718320.1 hypothetical protein [Niabella hibiscisoli]
MKLEADRTNIKADGEDISFVTVSIVDKNGNLCPVSDQSLQFSVKGNGVFKAACNGDATSLEPFHLPTMKTFGGKLVVLVQALKTAGAIELMVNGKGLKGGQLSLKTVNL